MKTATFKKLFLPCIILSLCLVAAWFATRHKKAEPDGPPIYPLLRHVQYSFTLRNQSDNLQKNIRFSVRAPVRQTSSQLCNKVKSPHEYQLETDTVGNQTMLFNFEQMPPYSTKIVQISASISLAQTPNRLPEKDLNIYLEPQPYCESDHPEIKQIAAGLVKGEPIETAESIYKWVSSNINYAGYLKHPRGALYALTHKKGDCTEFMYLFTALCRASHIPARCIGGYICAKDTILRPVGYHNWSEFYIDGRWWTCDPQNKVFRKDGDRYLALRIIAPPAAENEGQFELFSVNGTDLKVKMN